jgi:hypothetical protein
VHSSLSPPGARSCFAQAHGAAEEHVWPAGVALSRFSPLEMQGAVFGVPGVLVFGHALLGIDEPPLRRLYHSMD